MGGVATCDTRGDFIDIEIGYQVALARTWSNLSLRLPERRVNLLVELRDFGEPIKLGREELYKTRRRALIIYCW